MYRKAMEIQEEVLGESHLQTAEVYFHLGRLLWEIHDNDNGLTLMHKCLGIRLTTLGRHWDTAMTYCHIGLLLGENGETEEGLTLARKAQDILEEIVGRIHPDTAFCYSSLATLLRDEDQPGPLKMLQHCRAIQETLLGESHINLGTTCSQTGSLLGRLNQSRDLFLHALAIARSSNNESNPSLIAPCCANLSVTALVMGDHATAAEMGNDALSALQVSPGGENYQCVVDVFDSVGEDMLAAGDFDNAMLVYRQSLSMRKAIFGSLDSELAVGHERIGLALYSKGEHPAALKEYEQSLAIRESSLDEGSADLLATEDMVDSIRLQMEKERSLL